MELVQNLLKIFNTITIIANFLEFFSVFKLYKKNFLLDPDTEGKLNPKPCKKLSPSGQCCGFGSK